MYAKNIPTPQKLNMGLREQLRENGALNGLNSRENLISL